ncbi:hypothetical protein [Streptomyces sp. CA-253872]|uniref:hypothetical protein n=1 Tax=Streptomyces sp. CA-253872 TaxID=3240067 RepID=UPI003D8CAF66
MRLLGPPADREILAPMAEREAPWHLLRGEQGPAVRGALRGVLPRRGPRFPRGHERLGVPPRRPRGDRHEPRPVPEELSAFGRPSVPRKRDSCSCPAPRTSPASAGPSATRAPRRSAARTAASSAPRPARTRRPGPGGAACHALVVL